MADLRAPTTLRGAVVDHHFGVAVPDPYRWLEDPDTADSRAWIEAQNAHTERFLAASPAREALRARLQALWDHPRLGTPSRHGGRTFWFANTGLQAQAPLWVQDHEGAAPRVLLDPNTLSADGTVSLAMTSIRKDGALLAWSSSDGGSDWQTWRVRQVADGVDTTDELRWIKFSGVAWAPDGQGFTYARFPAPTNPLEQANHHNKVYFHRLGDPQEADTLVFEAPDQPTWEFWPQVTHDGDLLVLSISDGTEPKNRLYLRDARDPAAPWLRLFDRFDASYVLLGKVGQRLFFSTNLNAPRGRILAVDLDQPGRLLPLVAEQPEALESASLVGGRLILSYLRHAASAVFLHNLDGQRICELPLPGIGAVVGFAGAEDDDETFFTWSGFLSPPRSFALTVATAAIRPWSKSAVDFDEGAYEVHQRFFRSADGTEVPLFVMHRKGLALDGRNPTQLYGYGGFSISLTPNFSVERAVWLEMGGVYAIANLRGGGEYGAAWHDAGRLRNKQNTFDDFIAAAEHLIAWGYTAPDKLAIAGGSNGGLLVGAVMTQRPELFAAALPAVGVLDMLRYHLFTIGWAWASDYGRADDPDMFPLLHAYSPLHRLQPGTAYPATLITTGDHDDRVVPAHSFKFAAALQAAQGGAAPILIRIETRGGHGAGRSTQQRIDEAADRWAFLDAVLGLGAPR